MKRKQYEILMGKHCDEKAILDYDFNMIAGKVLKRRRIELGLSLDNLSDKMNNLVSKQAISRYENGKVRIKNSIFAAICSVLNTTTRDMFCEIIKCYNDYLDENLENILKRINDDSIDRI